MTQNEPVSGHARSGTRMSREELMHMLFERLVEAKRVDSGENLIVLVPEDEGVFLQHDDPAWIGERLGYTNPFQTYVDLYHAGGRGEEAAEAILEQRIKPEWKRQGFVPGRFSAGSVRTTLTVP